MDTDGQTWRTPSGTNYTFNEDGKGFRQFGNDKSDFKWKQKGKDNTKAKLSLKPWTA